MHQFSRPEALTSTELLKEITANASLLIKRQVTLAKLEATEELKKSRAMAEWLGAAGLLAYAAAILLLMAAALGIGAALDGRYWAGALIVAGVLGIGAAVTGIVGYRKRVKNPLHRSLGEIAKEITWAKDQLTT